MDIEQGPVDFDELFAPELGDADGGDVPPDEPGEGPGRGRRSHPPPRERASHGMTAIICAIAIVMSGLFLLAIQTSQSGGGITSAYVISFAIAFFFLATFYLGSLWLGAKRREHFPTRR